MGHWYTPPPEHLHGLRKLSPIMIVSPITQLFSSSAEPLYQPA
jgi:hypothetical protein